MNAEDVKSWLMTYELSIDVYICAEKYLMDAFKQCVATYITDMLETAGNDAAVPPILHSCKRVYERMATKDDILVKKILARVGFMLPQLWKRYPAETQEFWMDNVEVGCMMMKETMARRELDVPGDLPPMDRWPTNLPPPPPMMREYSRERPRRHYPAY